MASTHEQAEQDVKDTVGIASAGATAEGGAEREAAEAGTGKQATGQDDADVDTMKGAAAGSDDGPSGDGQAAAAAAVGAGSATTPAAGGDSENSAGNSTGLAAVRAPMASGESSGTSKGGGTASAANDSTSLDADKSESDNGADKELGSAAADGKTAGGQAKPGGAVMGAPLPGGSGPPQVTGNGAGTTNSDQGSNAAAATAGDEQAGTMTADGFDGDLGDATAADMENPAAERSAVEGPPVSRVDADQATVKAQQRPIGTSVAGATGDAAGAQGSQSTPTAVSHMNLTGQAGAAPRGETQASLQGSPSPQQASAGQGARIENVFNTSFERGYVGQGRGNGEMHLTVHRDDLGALQVHVAVREGAVHASIGTAHEAARQLLNGQRAELETALQRGNLKLDSFNVDVGEHEGRSPMPQDSPSYRRPDEGGGGGKSEPVVPGMTAVSRPAHAGMLSVRA